MLIYGVYALGSVDRSPAGRLTPTAGTRCVKYKTKCFMCWLQMAVTPWFCGPSWDLLQAWLQVFSVRCITSAVSRLPDFCNIWSQLAFVFCVQQVFTNSSNAIALWKCKQFRFDIFYSFIFNLWPCFVFIYRTSQKMSPPPLCEVSSALQRLLPPVCWVYFLPFLMSKNRILVLLKCFLHKMFVLRTLNFVFHF